MTGTVWPWSCKTCEQPVHADRNEHWTHIPAYNGHDPNDHEPIPTSCLTGTTGPSRTRPSP